MSPIRKCLHHCKNSINSQQCTQNTFRTIFSQSWFIICARVDLWWDIWIIWSTCIYASSGYNFIVEGENCLCIWLIYPWPGFLTSKKKNSEILIQIYSKLPSNIKYVGRENRLTPPERYATALRVINFPLFIIFSTMPVIKNMFTFTQKSWVKFIFTLFLLLLAFHSLQINLIYPPLIAFPRNEQRKSWLHTIRQ